MSVMKSVARHAFDAEASVLMRAEASAAVTSSEVNNLAIDLQTLLTTDAYWDNDDVPNQDFNVNIHVTALDEADGDETYRVEIIGDDDTTWNDSDELILGYVLVSQTGPYNVLLDGDTIRRVFKGGVEGIASGAARTPRYITCRAILAGTTPSLDYFAWVGPTKN